MKKIIMILSLAVFSLSMQSCDTASSEKPKKLETDNDKFSYAVGLDIGLSLGQIKDEIDLDIVFQGIRDTLINSRCILSSEEVKEAKDLIFKKMREKKQATDEIAKVKNKKEGEEFLEKNKTKDGVVTTESGLQYTILNEGKGDKPKATDKVKVHYKGTLLDGKEFDSSYKRGKPTEFRVNGVIKGWTEALLLMNPGSKYKLFIPSGLAYGERGAGADISPNTTLVFEVELLEILK